MGNGGWSVNLGRSSKDNRWKLQFTKVAWGKPRPQIDNEDCWTGVRLDLVWGPLVLPVVKLYHWRFWKDEPEYSQQWNNGNQWFTIKLPFFCFLFVSVMLGRFPGGLPSLIFALTGKRFAGVPGFYLGARTADLSNVIDWQLRLDWNKPDSDPAAWAWNEDGSPKEAWPVGDYKGKKTVELSAAVRSDFTQ